MIIVSLINLFVLVLHALTAARPPWVFTLPASVLQVMQYLFSMDNILPVSESFICMLASIALLSTLVTIKGGVKFMDWVADIIP